MKRPFAGKRGSRKKLLPLVFLTLSEFSFAGAQPPVIGGLERAGNETIAGAVLAGELSCTACHSSDQAAFAAKAGPDLSAIGARANGEHLRRFLADPRGVKPGTTMPDSLGHLPEHEREAAAGALAHYLVSLIEPAPSAPLSAPPSAPPSAEAVDRGRVLYHSVGCVACHAPEKPLPGSVPLGPLSEKYTVASLTAFLKDPLASRPAGRMPDGRFEHFEAEDIASYLLREQKAPLETFSPDAALAARGRILFVEYRCHACHDTGEEIPPPSLTAWDRLRPGEGCLSETRGPWPHYPLSERQRTRLRSAIDGDEKGWTPAEMAELTLARLNCLACHERDGFGGAAADRSDYFTGHDETLGEQGRLPPTLTGVGAKLKSAWLREVLVNGAAARPYLHTRMPKFGAAQTEPLAAWLKQLDTLPAASFTRVAKEEKPHEIGRELAGTKGFNCVACHTFRGRSASPIRALDLMTMTERLEEDWFHHFLTQPQRFVPLTVMPGFWPDGTSPLTEVLGGDPGRQRDALWQYLAEGPEAREPAGLVLEPLEVKVGEEAVIVRRAFPGIGKRGLGVGYPGGLNLAFDTEQMRLAALWRGGFIEASSLWRGQGSGQARLLGKKIAGFPAGPAIAVLDPPDAPWPGPDTESGRSAFSFLGYSLDAQQRPTLRYALAGFAVEDLFIERSDAGGKRFFERTLTFPETPPAGMFFRVAADKRIEPRGTNNYAVGEGLRVRLPATPVIREAGETKELLLPVRGEMKLEYHLTDSP